MSKTVTLRLDDPVYRLLKGAAEQENRSISNFIETAVMRFVREHETVDEFEMAKIRGNAELNQSLRRGHRDAKHRRGTFAWIPDLRSRNKRPAPNNQHCSCNNWQRCQRIARIVVRPSVTAGPVR